MPYWIAPTILELPCTTGFTGLLPQSGEAVHERASRPPLARLAGRRCAGASPAAQSDQPVARDQHARRDDQPDARHCIAVVCVVSRLTYHSPSLDARAHAVRQLGIRAVGVSRSDSRLLRLLLRVLSRARQETRWSTAPHCCDNRSTLRHEGPRHFPTRQGLDGHHRRGRAHHVRCAGRALHAGEASERLSVAGPRTGTCGDRHGDRRVRPRGVSRS